MPSSHPARPAAPTPEGAPVLWVDHPEQIAHRANLPDLATLLHAAGRTLWVSAPEVEASRCLPWSAEAARRVDAPAEMRPLEDLIAGAELVVVTGDAPGMLGRLVLALGAPNQQVILGHKDGPHANVAAARGAVEALARRVGREDDPTLAIIANSALADVLRERYGAGARRMVLGPALPFADALRETPFPPPTMVPEAIAPEAYAIARGGAAGPAYRLVDRRNGGLLLVHNTQAWTASSAARVMALLGQDAAAFAAHRHQTPARPVLTGDELLLIGRQASRATLRLPWAQTAIQEAARRIVGPGANLWGTNLEALIILRRRERAEGLVLLSPEAAERADALIASLQAKVPAWQVQLDQFFHGEVPRAPADTGDLGYAIRTGLMPLPVPPALRSAKNALGDAHFWIAAALEHGGMPRAIAVMRRQAGLGRELGWTATKEAIARGLAWLAEVDPQARQDALDMAERGANALLREIGLDALDRCMLLPEGLTAETLARLPARQGHLPLDLQKAGRAGTVTPPAPEPPRVAAPRVR